MAVISALIGVAVGAAVGAAVGGLTSGLTGGNVGKGILFGALGGGLSGGVGGAFSGGLTGLGGSMAIAPTTAGFGTIAASTAGGLSAMGAAALAGGIGGIVGGFAGGRFSSSSVKAQNASANALKTLQETGMPDVNKTATLQDNSRFKRTLSSLRVPLGITPKQNTETITQNVYGVDTNSVATATQNMTGLNIATA